MTAPQVQAADSVVLAEKWRERQVPAFPIAISWDDMKGKTAKRPLTDHGHLDATLDRDTFIGQMKAAMMKIKQDEVLAVGLRAGPAGYVVFDGDLQDGDGNPADGPGFMRDTLKLPPYSYTVNTASDGIHRWLRKRNLTTVVGNGHPWPGVGLDIRSDDGWVVAPGTVTPWGEWAEYAEPGWGTIATIPEAVWDALVGNAGTGASSGGGSTWKRYRPAEHDELLHPATLEVLRWLIHVDRGERQVDVAAVSFRERAEGEPYLDLTRPGKSRGVSGTLGYIAPGVLKVFTSNWPGLDAGCRYSYWDLTQWADEDDPARDQQDHPGQSPHVSETAETAETAETGPRLWRANDLKPAEPTRWLVRGHLPLGQVAVLVGDEGIGKSLWWVLIVAHVTTGLACPALGLPARDPRDVLLVLTEDSWTADVRPRLEAAGADLGRIVVVAEDDDGSGSPIFPRDMPLITRGAEGLDLALVVVDAWLDTVDSGKQVKDPQQARQALHPWRNTAATTGASVLLLAHSNRSDVSSLRDKVGATAALRQKARVLLYAAQPPESQGVMYLGPNKANSMAIAEAIAYKVNVVQVRPATDDDPGTIARLSVLGRTGATMEDHHVKWRAAIRRAEHPSADDRVKPWLLAYIGKHGQDTPLGRKVAAKTAQDAAHANGHNPERLAKIVRAEGGYAGPDGPGGPWIYRLPINSQRQSPQSPQSPQSQEHGEDWTETGATVTDLFGPRVTT